MATLYVQNHHLLPHSVATTPVYDGDSGVDDVVDVFLVERGTVCARFGPSDQVIGAMHMPAQLILSHLRIQRYFKIQIFRKYMISYI
jgi:hypothetical protein